jgi:hypothetical protein
MPSIKPQFTKEQILRAYAGLRDLSDKEAIFFLDGCLLAISEIAEEYRLSLREATALARLFNHFTFDDRITKTLLLSILGQAGKKGYELKEPFSSFFFFEKGKGYCLSSSGLAALGSWGTSLRRVLQDREEFYKLKFGRWTPEARAKRRSKQRFWQLPEAEQIRILREYYCMPYRNDEEKRLRKRKRIEIFKKYDLRNWDLLNAVQKYGDIVKSVRNLPEYRDLFPAYRRNSNS